MAGAVALPQSLDTWSKLLLLNSAKYLLTKFPLLTEYCWHKDEFNFDIPWQNGIA